MTDFFDDLIACIQADDLSSFQTYESKRELRTLRMGRFPVLSVVYLFSAKKIASYCEQTYIKDNAWTAEREPFSLSYAFGKIAGRALRLYVNEVVSPLEMLLLLDKTKRLCKIYPLARPSQAQKARLTSVWSILYSLRVTCLPDRIEIEKRPKTRYERRRLLLSICSILLSVAILSLTPFFVNVFYPFINVSNNQQDQDSDPEIVNPGSEDEPETPVDDGEVKYYNVSSIAEIDFASNNEYTLKEDVIIPEAFHTENMNCTLKGEDHTIVLPSAAPLFDTLKGTIRNVRFALTTDSVITQDTALIATSNEGKLDNVTLSLRGSLRYEKTEDDSITVAGLIVTNTRSGKILRSSVDCDLTLSGQTEANGTFVGICARNNGEIGECSSSGSIASDCVDLAGICDTNAYYLHDCVNACALRQRVSVQNWNPICAGIVLTNNYSTTLCRNEGVVSVSCDYASEEAFEEGHTFAEAMAAGIVASNTYSVTECVNAADIQATAVENLCYAAGIASVCAPSSTGFILYTPSLKNCTNAGKITVSCERITSFAGGIAAYGKQAYFDTCINEADGIVSATIENCTYAKAYLCVGGIGGNTDGCSFPTCENHAPVAANAVVQSAYVGGIAALSGSVASGTSNGNVSLSGTVQNVYVGGVVASVTGGVLSSCAFTGNMTVQGDIVYAGGIAALSYFTISSSYSSGRIDATGREARVGGILGYSPITLQNSRVYCGDADSCLSAMSLAVTGTEIAFAGGIVGYGDDGQYYRGTEPVYRGASVLKSFFTGTISGENIHKGTIFGGCGEYIYANRRDDKLNFADDYVLSSDPFAVGAYKPTESEEYVAGGNIEGVTVQTLAELQSNETYAALVEKYAGKE